MARTRSTKKLSQRIDREYFKRLYPIPRWRRILSIAATGVGLAWVLSSLAINSGAVFNAGPLSKGHHILEGNCASCHTGSKLWGRKVEEKACVSCHDGPAHKEHQTFTPACLSCHIEHKGSAVEITDASCTQCHASLQTKNGKNTVAAKVTAFDSVHPDFKARTDPGTIKFGHQVHMKPDLRGPNGTTQLKCSTCHTPSRSGEMAIANFKDNCESCHRLEFHRRIDQVLPHDKPEVVLAFARSALTKYIAEHPGDVNLVEPAIDPRIMVQRVGPAGNATEWIRRRMEDTETLMWRKTCIECHTPSPAREIPKAQITAHWLTGAKFDHAPHQIVACAECHGAAVNSKATSDVMLPGIQTCQQCHRTSNPSASANCTECHVYHDWSKAKPIDTKRKIDELLNR
ncbi:MAG: hypothetical protein ABIR70_23250 [Bryobacteraceae bacterium]